MNETENLHFYAKGLRLLRSNGVLVYISSNKFMRAGYGERLRRGLLAGQTTVQTVIDFGDLPVFDATTYPAVLVLSKRPPAAEQTTQTLVVTDIAVVFWFGNCCSAISEHTPKRNGNRS